MTAVTNNVTTDIAEAVPPTDTTSVSSNRPVVDVMDARELSSGCLKRPYCGKKTNPKKPKLSAEDSRSTAAAGGQLTRNDEAAVVSSSLSSDGSQSAESSSVENREDRCLLSTSTGLFPL